MTISTDTKLSTSEKPIEPLDIEPIQELPLCACVEFWPKHHPECPARRTHESLLTEVRRLRSELAVLREYHKRNVNALSHKFKHQEKGHQCGWKVLLESVIERSKSALEKDNAG